MAAEGWGVGRGEGRGGFGRVTTEERDRLHQEFRLQEQIKRNIITGKFY